MNLTILKWHEMPDIPQYEQILLVLCYKYGYTHYKIGKYWESDKHFHENDTTGHVPRVINPDFIVAWAYLPILVEKQTNNEVK